MTKSVLKKLIRECINEVSSDTQGMYELLQEDLATDYFIQKTTDKEVEDLLLRGHYLEHWPFAGSQYKDFIYGIYRESSGKSDLNLGEIPTKPVLVGCVVYGYAEHHAARYIQDWIRELVSPNETLEKFVSVIQNLAKKDDEEREKAKKGGYPFKPKLEQTIKTFLNIVNVQQKEIIELKRLYILPKHDTKNIESFAIQKANDEILNTRPEINVIISFSDSKVGHYGGIYQATNAAFAGYTKHKLLRYVYFRPNIANTIKKYQTAFEKIAFNYPKQSDIVQKKPKMDDWDFENNPESNTKVVNFLKKRLTATEDTQLNNALNIVIDYLNKNQQIKFRFNNE